RSNRASTPSASGRGNRAQAPASVRRNRGRSKRSNARVRPPRTYALTLLDTARYCRGGFPPTWFQEPCPRRTGPSSKASWEREPWTDHRANVGTKTNEEIRATSPYDPAPAADSGRLNLVVVSPPCQFEACERPSLSFPPGALFSPGRNRGMVRSQQANH